MPAIAPETINPLALPSSSEADSLTHCDRNHNPPTPTKLKQQGMSWGSDMNSKESQQLVLMAATGVSTVLALHYIDPITANLPSPWNTLLIFAVVIGIVAGSAVVWNRIGAGR